MIRLKSSIVPRNRAMVLWASVTSFGGSVDPTFSPPLCGYVGSNGIGISYHDPVDDSKFVRTFHVVPGEWVRMAIVADWSRDGWYEVWADVGNVNQTGIACSTGGDCPYGEAQDMELVEVTDADLQRALEVMESSVLPQWAQRCGEECVQFWNETAGKALGISAGQQ